MSEYLHVIALECVRNGLWGCQSTCVRTMGYQSTGMLEYWDVRVGMLEQRESKHLNVGALWCQEYLDVMALECVSNAISKHWNVGALGCQSNRMSEHWDVGVLGFQITGTSEYQDVKTLECWSNGIPKHRNIGASPVRTPGCQITGMPEQMEPLEHWGASVLLQGCRTGGCWDTPALTCRSTSSLGHRAKTGPLQQH